MKSGRRQMLDALAFASNMGFIMAVNAAVGLFMGKGIDKLFDSSPWGVGIGTAFGLIAGLRAIFRRATALDDGNGNEKKTSDPS